MSRILGSLTEAELHGIVLDKNTEIKSLRAQLKSIQETVDIQAKDYGLWFEAETVPETYLQEQLRCLHRIIEGGADDE